MDENEERLEIGVETYSPGPFKNEPYSVEELAFLREFNQELKEDFVDYIQACGKKIITENGEVLYQVSEGRYRIVYAEQDNQRSGAPKILDVESVLLNFILLTIYLGYLKIIWRCITFFLLYHAQNDLITWWPISMSYLW